MVSEIFEVEVCGVNQIGYWSDQISKKMTSDEYIDFVDCDKIENLLFVLFVFCLDEVHFLKWKNPDQYQHNKAPLGNNWIESISLPYMLNMKTDR